MEKEMKLGDVIIDCGDPIRLRDFYAELLNWEKCELYDLLGVRSSNGIVLLFIQEDDYVSPVWPEAEGKQQKQMHFDFQTHDLPAMVKRAEELGAVKAESQFGGKYFVTMFDPAGHPFCLCLAE